MGARFVTALSLLALVACTEEAYTLVVDVRTDYAPGVEFAVARAVLDGQPERIVAAPIGGDFGGGVRLAEHDGVAEGDHELDVALVDISGEVVVERRVRVSVVENIAMTVVLTRSCGGVMCPQTDPEASTCLGGLCVNPSCSEVDTGACPGTCASDGECMATAACTAGRCVEGVCLSVPDDSMCASGEVCLPTTGCVADPTSDASVRDASADAIDGGTRGLAREITVTNISAAILPSGYTIRVGLGSAEPLAAAPDLSDVRVLTAGSAVTDPGITRVVDVDAPGQDRAVWFELAAEIAVGGDATYTLHYGDDSVAPPPDEPTDIFAVYDDFAGPALSPAWATLGTPTVSGTLVLGPGDNAVASDPSTDIVGPTSVLELRMTTTGFDAADTYFWVGYQQMGAFGTGAPFQNWVGRASRVYPWVNVMGVMQVCPDAIADDSPHWYRIERRPGATHYFQDGVMACEVSVDDTVDYAIQLRNQSTTASIEIDWVRARNIATPEPTVTLGPEEVVRP